MTNEAEKTETIEGKRQAGRSRERRDARKFIREVRNNIRIAFGNTGNSEKVADYFEATPRSTADVILAGHDEALANLRGRVEAIERRLGMGRASTITGRFMELSRRRA